MGATAGRDTKMTAATATAAALRAAIKAAGIRAKVAMLPGYAAVRVVVPAFDARFTSEEIATFCTAALGLGLTFVRGMPIDPAAQAALTGKMQWEFYL
jgi:hypothetical protein